MTLLSTLTWLEEPNLHFSQDLPFLIGLRDHMGLDLFLQVMYSCYQLHSYNSK